MAGYTYINVSYSDSQCETVFTADNNEEIILCPDNCNGCDCDCDCEILKSIICNCQQENTQELCNTNLDCINEDCCEDDDCDHNCETKCGHEFIHDLVDIDPDRAQEIVYCSRCYFILAE